MSKTNEAKNTTWHDTTHVNMIDKIQLFVMINNVGIIINVDVNVKN